MSRTYDLCCDNCRTALWIGQGRSADQLHIYTAAQHIADLNAFLRQHMGHSLRFLDSELTPDGYRQIDEDGDS